MGVRTTESVRVPAAPEDVFPHVATLDRYPAWMRLVHEATAVASDGSPAWSVEIRARVGPFARSKRLRMVRSVHEPSRLVEFERSEVDGRDHATWTLRVEVEPDTVTSSIVTSSIVTVHLAYDGVLWTGGLLDRVLDEEIRRGRAGLTALITGEPTH